MQELNGKEVVYFTNSLGEETGNATCPEEVWEWRDRVAAGSSADWLEYLVLLNGTYGLALIHEVAHADCDNNEDYDVLVTESSDAAFSRLCKIADSIPEQLVFVGNETGIFARHELVVLVPVHTLSEDYDKIRESLQSLTGSVDNFLQM